MARAPKKKPAPKLFCPHVPRTDGEWGHLYETPHGNFWGATTFIGVLDKPALKFWYASQQTTYVIAAAADLWEDAPVITDPKTKMSRATFIATLKKRVTGVKAAQKAMEKAQDIGTQAHALVEWTLKNELGIKAGPRPFALPEAEWAFQSWETWRASVNLEPLWIEQVVYSAEHEYAGTVDLIARLDLKDKRHDYGRVLAVIDWKTGKRHYPESSMQAAAYAQAIHEMGHSDGAPPVGLVIRLPKVKEDPGFDPKVVHSIDHASNFGAFLNAKAAWHWLRSQENEKHEAPRSLADQIAASIRSEVRVEGAPF